MPADAPPSYTAAVGQHAPAMSLTTPQGQTVNPANDTANQHAPVRPGEQLNRTVSGASSTMSDDDNLTIDDGMNDEERRSFDDEHRDLPDGWVRCFDVKQQHHFYVETKTKRAIWTHPYDDPEFLQSLPDTHPANPNSAEAREIQQRAKEEEEMIRKAKESKNAEGRSWFQKKKDALIGTKEERAAAKAQKAKARAELEKQIRQMQKEQNDRRRALLQRQMLDPRSQRLYASDPYGYAAPLGSFSRSGGLYGSPYGYGYGGGYGRRYGGYGYGGYGGMGMGMPLAAGMGLGLGGGMLLGGGLGGFGGGFGGGGFDGGGGGGGDCGGGGGM